MVRAEAPADAEAQVDGFLGRVRAVVYLGSRVRVEAVTADGVDAWADLREDEAEGLAEGDWVGLSWSAAAASVWAGESRGSED